MRSPVAAVASIVLAGSLLLTGCSVLPGDSDDPAPTVSSTKVTALKSTAWERAKPGAVTTGGTLRLAASTLPANFNPQHPDGANPDTTKILAPTAGGAVRITSGGGWTVDPRYATSVTVDDESPLKVKVVLNPKAVWQDGSPITADDMTAFWKAQNGSNDDIEVASTAGYQDIADVRRGTDKFTYTVEFKKRTSEWPQFVYPRLPAPVSSSPKDFNEGFRSRAVPSNGPYVVQSIDTKRGVVTEVRNPRWWGAKPKLGKITWNIATPDLQAKAYVAGDLDAVDLDAAGYATADGTGTVQRAAGIEWSQVTLNGGRGPLRDVKVRRAVARAIDREGVAASSARPFDAPASTLGSLILVPGQSGYQDSSAPIDRDVAAAQKLLADAGWTRGTDGIMTRKGQRLTLTMPVPSQTPTNQQRAKALSSDLKKVGIEVRLREVPSTTFFDQYVIPLDFDLVTFVRRGSPFPVGSTEPLFYPVDSPQNFTGLGASRYGKGWDYTTETLDEKLRLERVGVLDSWLFEDVPMVPLAMNPVVVSVRDGLVNYGAAQFEQPDWTRVGYVKK